MSKPGSTRIRTPRIVQPGGGGGRSVLWLFFLVALAAWSWQVFEFGRQRAGFDVGRCDQEASVFERRIEELEEERENLRAQAAKLERAGQIDRAAVNGVQGEVRSLQEERASLKREVAFLKKLVSGGGKKLALGDYDLVDLGEGKYRFEATLSKLGDDDNTVSGQVTIEVAGLTEGAPETLDLGKLTKGKRTNIGIRFKNYQKLKTDLALPSGFEPASITVAVNPDGNTFKSFEQVFEWKSPGA